MNSTNIFIKHIRRTENVMDILKDQRRFIICLPAHDHIFTSMNYARFDTINLYDIMCV